MLAGVCQALVRTSARGVVAGDAGGRLPGFGVQRQQGVDGLDLDSVPGPSDAGGRLPGFGPPPVVVEGMTSVSRGE